MKDTELCRYLEIEITLLDTWVEHRWLIPEERDGMRLFHDADLSRVWTVVEQLPELSGRPILVMKSTVPVGTGEKVRHGLNERGLQHVGYASNPEFLAEGRAVEDFMHPDRVVIGAFEDADGDAVASLYADIDTAIVRCDVNSAEMVKLASAAVVAESPRLTKVLGGISPIDPEFIRNLAGQGVLDTVDAVAVHGFPLDWNHWQFGQWPERIAEIEAVTHLPVWVTEVGVSTFGAEEVQEWGLKRTAELLSGRVPRVHWYSLFDLPKAWPATTRASRVA